MTKPTKETPHSDIDGIRRDDEPAVKAANRAGQTTADLERAEDLSTGRPDRSDSLEGDDDRTD